MGPSFLFLPLLALAGEQPAPAGYRQAPAAIRAVLDAPPPPAVLLAPGGDRALLAEVEPYPGLEDLARPVLRLAGSRFNPVNRAAHLPLRLRSLALLALPGGRTRAVPLPGGRAFGLPQWAPDGRTFALQAVTPRAVELWLGDAATGSLRPVPRLRLNAAFGNPIAWMPGSRSLLCETVPARQGPPPAAPARPEGPRIQEAGGDRPEPTRTYADLLQDPLDAARYTYYATAQLAVDQNEIRTLWEAPETYLKVSPFLAADRFTAPILLIHGEADENSGTFPFQSERLFQALKGNGKPVRYVSLPLEGHAYQARESVEHVLWEMIRWLGKNL